MKRIVLLFAPILFVLACSTQTQQPPVAPKPETVAPKPAIDQAKFEVLYRSAKSIQATITVGATYEKFGESLRSLTTEVSIAGDKATSSEENELVALYAKALEAYKDSYTLWQAKLEQGSSEVFVVGPNKDTLRSIPPKYGIPIIGPTDGVTIGMHYLEKSEVEKVWTKAATILDHANQLYLSLEP